MQAAFQKRTQIVMCQTYQTKRFFKKTDWGRSAPAELLVLQHPLKAKVNTVTVVLASRKGFSVRWSIRTNRLVTCFAACYVYGECSMISRFLVLCCNLFRDESNPSESGSNSTVSTLKAGHKQKRL
jgi:hypothetical protein